MANMPFRRRHHFIGVLAVMLVVEPMTLWAQTPSELEQLRSQIEALRRNDEEKQKQLDALEHEVNRLRKHAEAAAAAPTPPAGTATASSPQDSKQAALDRALEEVGGAPATPQESLWSRPVGSGQIRLIDVSLDVLTAGGTSTATDSEIHDLEGGAHDPNRRGFTLQQAELSLSGAVDPYLMGEAHIVFTTGGAELEEAFFTTQSLPYDLQIKAGYFLTEFGRMNPTHPHAWDWVDQPVINSRMFGGDGLRAPGARVSWLTPLPWYSSLDLGVQNANEGETTYSFIAEEGIGGRPPVYTHTENLGDLLYSARWSNAWNLTDETTLALGVSGLHGPNVTGSDGQTWIYGSDMKLRWRPADNFRGWPFFLWQTEVMKRDYTADWFVAGQETATPDSGHNHNHGGGEEPEEEAPEEDLPGAILRDWGLYSQALYGFHHGWAGGLRLEYASGHGESVGGRPADPFRDDRYRVSPLLVWQPTEYSRFRLQYNYDLTKFLNGNNASSVWIGGEILYGAHPAHQY